MRVLLSLAAVLLLSACGSQTPSSLWNELTDPPVGWHGAAPSEIKGYEPASIQTEESVSEVQAEEVILIEEEIVPINEPTQIAK